MECGSYLPNLGDDWRPHSDPYLNVIGMSQSLYTESE